MTVRGTSVLVLSLLGAGCATSPETDSASGAHEQVVDEPVPVSVSEHQLPEEWFDEEPVTVQPEPLLDRTQRTVEDVVTSTAQTVDNIFGSAEVEEEATVTRGRLSVGGQWDQRDGLRERIRLKARFGLPAVNKRTSLLLGRGDVNDFVDGSSDDNIDTLPDRFNDFQDEDWLLGIGYSRDATLRRGWSFGAGVRLKTPLEPFVRATYRWHKTFSDNWLWRVEPR